MSQFRSPGADAESTRIRHLRECIVNTFTSNNQNQSVPEGCRCPVLAPPPVQDPTTQNELSYILAKAVACPIVYTQASSVTLAGAQPVYTPQIPYFPEAAEPPQGPAVSSVSRQMYRISGIDAISKPHMTRPASGYTSNISANLNAAATTRYATTVLPIVPYPPCPPPFPSGPQPGVPTASAPRCIPGARVVG